jgi:hypothetical protein
MENLNIAQQTLFQAMPIQNGLAIKTGQLTLSHRNEGGKVGKSFL